MSTDPVAIHKHILYEASVQDTEVDLDLIDRMTQRASGKQALTLREDFSGTSLLACAWVDSDPEREAWGVDLHTPTLNWARKHRLPMLGDDAERVHLLEENVLTAQTPQVDVVAALNFSYMIFKQRSLLKSYFQSVYDSLTEKGVFVLDLFGGPHAQDVMKEKKRVPAGVDYKGTPYPDFTYVWDQTSFNAVTQEICCHIHFKGKKIIPIEKAFTYEWRLWSITEITDLLTEVGFVTVEPYFEGWDDEAETTDGQLKIRKKYENMLAWICYLSAVK
ncbi:class I SAM-dependent methyltransferase [Kiritimatiellota bacterium B12222]|nr:class I SAM-dependent methyltransferase [Kiritimatiellota bacterium B12222]